MTKIYIAFYDQDTGCREEWNTYYTPWVAATSRERAKLLAKERIDEAVKEDILYDYDIDLNQVSFDSIEDSDLREEVRIEYNSRIKRYIIEIQEGVLE
jgi:hypothetical protein